MSEADALELLQSLIWTVLIAAGPALLAAMIVGAVIAVLQALTQIQDATISFIPKMLVLLVVLITSSSFIGAHLFAFASAAYERIEKGY